MKEFLKGVEIATKGKPGATYVAITQYQLAISHCMLFAQTQLQLGLHTQPTKYSLVHLQDLIPALAVHYIAYYYCAWD